MLSQHRPLYHDLAIREHSIRNSGSHHIFLSVMAVPNEPSGQHLATDAPWHAAYPTPKNKSPAPIARQEVLGMLHATDKRQKAFVLIDLRRTDHEVIHDSIK